MILYYMNHMYARDYITLYGHTVLYYRRQQRLSAIRFISGYKLKRACVRSDRLWIIIDRGLEIWQDLLRIQLHLIDSITIRWPRNAVWVMSDPIVFFFVVINCGEQNRKIPALSRLRALTFFPAFSSSLMIKVWDTSRHVAWAHGSSRRVINIKNNN